MWGRGGEIGTGRKYGLEVWGKYHSELYVVISGLTIGVAKTALNGLYDRDQQMDGFKVLVVFRSQFDIHTVG